MLLLAKVRSKHGSHPVILRFGNHRQGALARPLPVLEHRNHLERDPIQ